MRHLLTIIVALLIVLLSGCTIQFKAKEIELEAQPPLTYRLNGIELAGLEMYNGTR